MSATEQIEKLTRELEDAKLAQAEATLRLIFWRRAFSAAQRWLYEPVAQLFELRPGAFDREMERRDPEVASDVRAIKEGMRQLDTTDF